MEFKEINVLEGIVQQIDHEGSFAGITVDLGNVDHIYSKIDMERSRYLLSTGEMSEEMLGETQG